MASMRRHVIIVLALLIMATMPVSAINITMENRTLNLSNNINYVVRVENSTKPMTALQVTFNYDPTAMRVNWVRQGDFLYYASDDAKLWHVWYGNGSTMVVSMLLFDYSIMQVSKSTLMTINMHPLKKGITFVNLSNGSIIVNGSYDNAASGMWTDYSIKVT
jgi:hypothetical protein